MKFSDDFKKRIKAVCPQESMDLNTFPLFDEALAEGNLAVIGLVLRDARERLSPPTPEEALGFIAEESWTELKNLFERIVQLNRLHREYDQMASASREGAFLAK